MPSDSDQGVQSTGLHCAVAVSSAERGKAIFGELLGLPVTRTFSIGRELVEALFHRRGETEITVYDAGQTLIEVFVDAEMKTRSNLYDHLCFQVSNLASLLDRAVGMGLTVRRFHTGVKEIVFVRDLDGNLYELKEVPPA